MVVRVKLRVSAEQSDALSRTLALCNEVATMVAVRAHTAGVFRPVPLQQLCYQDAKAAGLSAQPAIHTIRKAADAYATLHANARTSGAAGRRHRRALDKPVVFSPDAAQPFDDRCLSWQHDQGTVSIWTVDGRLRNIPYVGHPAQVARLREHRKGESDLVTHQGNWFLIATLDVPDRELIEPDGFLGVDLGIVNIAATSTGKTYTGSRVNRVRERNLKLRQKLQKKGTKSARRLLKKRSRRESRFVTDTNHVISKQIVAEAERTGKGIATEDLRGIRSRARLRKPQRARLHSWAFAQLGAFLAYKATAAGIPYIQVDPAYTSQQCSTCGHTEKQNRQTQAEFACRNCGVSLNADTNASLNIAHRGDQAWGAVNRPNAARTPQPVMPENASPTLQGRVS